MLPLPPEETDGAPHRPARAYLALDVGDVRIGVALSRSGLVAEPHTTIPRLGRRQTLDALQEIVEANGVGTCVVGLPLLERGGEGEQAAKTREFVRSLQRRMPQLEVVFRDERHTSSEAREIAGHRRMASSDRGLVDRLAAAIILQEFLDARGSQGNTTTERGTT